MNSATTVLLAIAGVAAVLNWISRWIDSRPLEYLTKPTVTALLAVAAVTIDVRDTAARPWFVAALVLSLAGDVLLMLPSQRFVEGLASFLLGHVAYVVGFIVAGLEGAALLVGAIVVPVAIGAAARPILRGVRTSEPALAVPVTAYMVVIGTMVACSIGSTEPWAIAGAALFAFSDSLIAWDRFVAAKRWASVAIMITYHLGQFGLLISLAR